MGTKKQDKIEKYRQEYGDNYKLYCFDWIGDGGNIGCAPANNLQDAWERLITDLTNIRHDWVVRTLLKAQRHKMLSRLVTVNVIKLEKPTVYVPAKWP